MKKSRILSAIAAAAVAAATFVTMAVPASAADSYHAYLGVQEPTGWSFRNAWYDPTYGLGVTSEDGMVYFDQVTGWDESNNAVEKGGDFTDVEITADGTYKVALTGDFDFGAAEAFSVLFVSTDIPLDAGVSVTDVKVIFDGTTKYTFDEAFQDPDDKNYVHPLCINQWNSDVNELFGYVMPTSSIEVEFTVSGIDAALAGGAADTATTTTTAPETGNVPAAVMLSVMAVAGAAAVATKKRK